MTGGGTAAIRNYQITGDKKYHLDGSSQDEADISLCRIPSLKPYLSVYDINQGAIVRFFDVDWGAISAVALAIQELVIS